MVQVVAGVEWSRLMQIVTCTYDAHAGEILAILNDAIRHTTALYDYRPREIESMREWFSAKADGRYPVLGAVGEAGGLLGFASYGAFRAWPAYKYTVEHSVYVHRAHRGRGIGRELMRRLIAVAADQGYHVLVGGIDAANGGSIAFHQALGFVHAGTVREVGFKFGRWLDLAFYQLVLDGPEAPEDE